MKKTVISTILSLVVALSLSSCGVTNTALTRGMQYSKMYEEKPLTLLVMPPINNTSNIEAKEYLYTSINQPLAEAGYYIVSPAMAMDILKAESAYDAELFINTPLTKFQQYFGADAVIFSEINSWTKTLSGIKTNIRYFIKSTSTGEILFDKTCDLYLDLSKDISSQNSILGTLANLAATALSTATTEHIEAARKANGYAFHDIPYGKYHPLNLQDKEYTADPAVIQKNIR